MLWLSQADTCVSAPCLGRDSPCRPKAESSNPRLGTESSETRLAHSARHHKEWSASKQTQVPPTVQQGCSGDDICVIPEDRSKDVWIAAAWMQEWEASGPTRVHRHVADPGEGVNGEGLSRKHWTILNRLRTGVGRYRACMKKWRLADSTACECGEPEQTVDHIINSCPVHRPPSKAGLFEVGPLTRAWLQQTELIIWYDDIRNKKTKMYKLVRGYRQWLKCEWVSLSA